MISDEDRRFMRACLRFALRHQGLTDDNPSVGTLIVRDGVVVGRGVTARGGRPHAEPIALRQAGELARGATAYVTLEPCAHSARTPPCAKALIAGGVKRVVTAYRDPDERVDGKGHALLGEAGIEVDAGCESERAASDLAGYLKRKTVGRPLVTLKLAMTEDGFLGRRGEETPITGAEARAQVHMMRARADAILVGRGTVQADDPELTVRLPGLEDRSPVRYLAASANDLKGSRLERSARRVRTYRIGERPQPDEPTGWHRADIENGRIDLGDLLSSLGEDDPDLAFSNLLVEGGAALATSFLDEGLVDRIVRFRAPHELSVGIASPIAPLATPDGFRRTDERVYGRDVATFFERI